MNWFESNMYGNIRSATVARYAPPVYAQDLSASDLPSLFAERNSLDAIENVAEIPTIRPERATIFAFARANVKPAILPASSTRASLKPRTMLPIYFKLSSSRTLTRAVSCSSSCSLMKTLSGTSSARRAYSLCAASSPRSISLTANVNPKSLARTVNLITFHF